MSVSACPCSPSFFSQCHAGSLWCRCKSGLPAGICLDYRQTYFSLNQNTDEMFHFARAIKLCFAPWLFLWQGSRNAATRNTAPRQITPQSLCFCSGR
ncbi:hypothetical protein EHJ07_06445 [Cronobacter muytjensii]|nr:hypothetical protein [Cronobacter muytjensii]